MKTFFAKNYQAINKNRDFTRMFKKGEAVVTWGFVCYFRQRNGKNNRLGIVTSKKIGNAVKRNRSRRVIREAFRLIEPLLRQKTEKRFDFIFVARAKTPFVKSTQIYGLMKKQILDKFK